MGTCYHPLLMLEPLGLDLLKVLDAGNLCMLSFWHLLGICWSIHGMENW